MGNACIDANIADVSICPALCVEFRDPLGSAPSPISTQALPYDTYKEQFHYNVSDSREQTDLKIFYLSSYQHIDHDIGCADIAIWCQCIDLLSINKEAQCHRSSYEGCQLGVRTTLQLVKHATWSALEWSSVALE